MSFATSEVLRPHPDKVDEFLPLWHERNDHMLIIDQIKAELAPKVAALQEEMQARMNVITSEAQRQIDAHEQAIKKLSDRMVSLQTRN